MAKRIRSTTSPAILPPERIESRIFLIRRQKVMVSNDLAALYGVPVKQFNQAVKRNAERFPSDFMFQLSEQEYDNLKLQFVTSSGKQMLEEPADSAKPRIGYETEAN